MKHLKYTLLILIFILSLFSEAKINANIANLKSSKINIIILINKKQYNNALSQINEQLKFYPKDHELYNLRGILNNTTGNYKLSINDFKKAIKLSVNPKVLASNNNNYYVNLCESYINLKDYANAKNSLKKALIRNPDLNITNIGQMDSVAAYEYKLFPDEASYKRCLKAVQEYFQSDSNLNNKELTYSWMGEFCTLFRVGNEQLNFFDIAIKIMPIDYHIFFYRAKYYIIHEQFDKAKQDLERALKLHDNDPDIIMTYAVMNYLSKNYFNSLKYCKIIIAEQNKTYLCKALLISCFDYNEMPIYKFIFGHSEMDKYLNQLDIPRFNKILLKFAIGDLDITNKQVQEKYTKELNGPYSWIGDIYKGTIKKDSWGNNINLTNLWFSNLTYLGLTYDNKTLREYGGSHDFELCTRLIATCIYSDIEDPTYLIFRAFSEKHVFDSYR